MSAYGLSLLASIVLTRVEMQTSKSLPKFVSMALDLLGGLNNVLFLLKAPTVMKFSVLGLANSGIEIGLGTQAKKTQFQAYDTLNEAIFQRLEKEKSAPTIQTLFVLKQKLDSFRRTHNHMVFEKVEALRGINLIIRRNPAFTRDETRAIRNKLR